MKGFFRIHLNQEFDKNILKGMDTVIHSAHSHTGRDDFNLNIEGTKKWFFASKSSGVKTQIFITSYSAKSRSQSEYGRIKYELEKFFIQEKQPVVRPGLVIGTEGIFSNMVKW